MDSTVRDVLFKVDMCINYQSLYAMEDDFNQVGLTIQTTSDNKIILSRIENNTPVTQKIINDYIYIGSLED